MANTISSSAVAIVSRCRFCVLYCVCLDCPDPPNNLQIFNVNSRNLTINWTKPHDNNDPITDYFVQYLNPVCLVDANILPLNMIANSTEEQVVISDLHPGEDFTFSVIAVNNICPSQFSLPSSVRTMEEGTYVRMMYHVQRGLSFQL